MISLSISHDDTDRQTKTTAQKEKPDGMHSQPWIMSGANPCTTPVRPKQQACTGDDFQ